MKFDILALSEVGAARSLGLHYDSPLGHLREYAQIVRTLTRSGSIDHDGRFYKIHAELNRSFDVPIMVGTLSWRMFELAGSIADGAITWLCPPVYIERVGIPHLDGSARDAGRTRPPLIAQISACMYSDAEAVRAEIRRTTSNIALESYQRMLVSAGCPEAAGGEWTDHLVDAVTAWGDEARVVSRVRHLFDAGADEVLVRPIGVGLTPSELLPTRCRPLRACETVQQGRGHGGGAAVVSAWRGAADTR